MKRIFQFLTVFFLSIQIFSVSQIYGQTNASINGFVRSSNGEAIPGATITFKNESTGFIDGVITNDVGFYVIKNIALGGPYTITAKNVGSSTEKRTGYTISIGENLKVDFKLSENTTLLNEVVIKAQDDVFSKFSPTGTAKRLGVQELKMLPASNRSFQDLASLSPMTGVSSPTNPNIGIGGNRESSTGVSLDGMNQRFMMNGGLLPIFTVSIEAVKEYEVSTNNYDVLQGRQGGGAINVITKSGTNQLTGSAFLYNRSQGLTSSTDYLGRTIKDFSINQYGFSLGGPLIKDKLHYFVAFDSEDRSQPFSVLNVTDLITEKAESISKVNLDKFLNILSTKYGLQDPSTQTGAFSIKPASRTYFGRIDWQINAHNKLTLRSNYSNQNSDFSTYASPDNAAVRESYGSHDITLFSTTLSLRSQISSKINNELKFQYLKAQRDFIPYNTLPRGFVNIASTLSDGITNVSRTFQFGGNRIAPEKQGEQQLQIVENIYLQAGKFNFTFGTDNLITFTHTLNSNEQGGLFQFASLDDLNKLKPSAYTRLVPLAPENGLAPFLNQTAFDVSAYAQMEYNLNPKMNLQAGLRWDATIFSSKPAYNVLVDKLLGKRTDVVASDYTNIQPRIQFTYDLKGDQSSVFQIGGGAFSANIVHWTQLSNILQSGVNLANVVYPSNALPTPDYPAYRADINKVPGVPVGGTIPPAYVNLVGNNFRAPITYKVNASFKQFFNRMFYVGANIYYANTMHNYRYQDLNLRDQPNFRLENEGGRGVFAPVEKVAVANPASPQVITYPIKYADVTKNPELSRVLELNGDASLWQKGVSFEAGIVFPKGAILSASFTINKTEDDNSYNCCIARTTYSSGNIFDDPRDLKGNQGAANSDFRNKIVVYGITPKWKGFQLGFKYVGISGNPWTPVIFGDITGDGSSLTINNNKRAFIFDPSTINSNPNSTTLEKALATNLTKLINNPDNTAADYLKSKAGQMAIRNELYNPFWHNVDINLSFTIDNQLIKSVGKHRIILQAQVFNFMNLLNKNAGKQMVVSGGNQQLFRALGLDPDAKKQERNIYGYQVNATFGQLVPANVTNTYQVQLGARYEF